jgi:FlaA1/EpsC-like NDP-sugar epimerase
VSRLVLVSTDKAVRPTSVMGASKRLAEIVIKLVGRETQLSACAVRFGNVLGSRGSVIPLFEKQIAAGGPVTVTDERMMRYFMTIPEAASLIIHAGAFQDRGVIYMLDMGEEVSIMDLARRMIQLHGMREDRDIKIRVTGLRPGEKLREDLSNDFELADITPHAKIRILKESSDAGWTLRDLRDRISSLRKTAMHGEAQELRDEILRCVRQLDSEITAPAFGSGHPAGHELDFSALVSVASA